MVIKEINPDKLPFIQAKHYRKGRIKPVQLIVMHTMETDETSNKAEAVAKYFQNTDTPASAHYCVDNDSAIQTVWDGDTAFGCKGANANGVHIEMAGRAKQESAGWSDEYSMQVLEHAAQVAAYLCKKFSIPVRIARFRSAADNTVVLSGICGHVDVPGHGSHYDPGKNFPWSYFLGLVQKYAN